jgi:tRNA(fMet)-specific endonuclease VapC
MYKRALTLTANLWTCQIGTNPVFERDSSILIAAERRAQPVSELLRAIKNATGSTGVMMSAISVIELCHGIWRANTAERMERRQFYVQEVFSAIPAQPFTKEMGELVARIDAEARKEGKVIPFADLQIGVTALQLGFEILTANVRHFEMIPDLVVRSF